MNLEKLLLLVRTLRHLRWEQLAYRPLRVAQFRLYRLLPQLAFRSTEIGAAASSVSRQSVETIRQAFNERFAHLNQPLAEFDGWLNDLKQNHFKFLNRSLTIHPKVEWNKRYENHLWNYQLHYFGFAPLAARTLAERGEASAWQACRRLIERWIDDARVGRSDGWDAYPISLRVVNWIYAYSLVADREDESFLAKWRASMFDQLGFLSRHLEHHLLANHLLKNIKALVIGGLFFQHENWQNESWLAEGERLLWRELDEQVLADGGHYERSPMYHAQTLADFLESYALLRAFSRTEPNEKIEARLQAMAGFLSAMSYPDGTLALFNDSANTVETRPLPILESATRIVGADTQVMTSFSQTGYYLWASADGREKIIVDAGEPSVTYNTAHAHCDLLSYELWLDGQPFIVDSGVHGYGGDRFREYCRSTRAHNTVMFDGIEQSEVWSTFRMARRAKVLNSEANGDDASWNFCGKFERYDGKVIHHRRIHRSEFGEWTVTDFADGDVGVASSFVHLHPAIEAELIDGKVICRLGIRRVVIEAFGQCVDAKLIVGSEAPIQGWRFDDFGIAEASAVIQFDYRIGKGKEFGYRMVALPTGRGTDSE
ncbi:MAG TPA: alginate lyase family protein [Blastocatellia bacterium]|nr:alginate lyase family protein [Blastocatellia bacterium]